jgi:hypothetical protein
VRETYPGLVLDLSSIDLEEIAGALADQDDFEHHWLIDPDTGEIAFWRADTGIDGQTPVDLDELDLVVIDPLPSWVWYQDMADFADGITDARTGRRLARAISTRPSCPKPRPVATTGPARTPAATPTTSWPPTWPPAPDSACGTPAQGPDARHCR